LGGEAWRLTRGGGPDAVYQFGAARAALSVMEGCERRVCGKAPPARGRWSMKSGPFAI
jgi:hypothetical protein